MSDQEQDGPQKVDALIIRLVDAKIVVPLGLSDQDAALVIVDALRELGRRIFEEYQSRAAGGGSDGGVVSGGRPLEDLRAEWWLRQTGDEEVGHA